MSKVLEVLIARGRRERKPLDQRQVAFSLAEISTNIEFHDKMIEKGVIHALLKLLKSDDSEALRFSSICLANIAYSNSTRKIIVQEGLLSVISSILQIREADKIAKQYLGMTLGNLAAEPENHEALVKFNVLTHLLEIVDMENPISGLYPAFFVSNLAVNNEYRSYIVQHENLVSKLITLACCTEHIQVQKSALLALRSICIEPKYRVLCIKEGVLDPLILISRLQDLDLKREIASAFASLSSVDEVKSEIADRALLTILALCILEDPEILQHACATLANLMEIPELHHRFMKEKNAFLSVLSLLKSPHVGIQGEACRTMANLSANEMVQRSLIENGILPPIIDTLVCTPHFASKRFSALTLANLAIIAEFQVEIVQLGAVKPLIELAKNFDMELEARRYGVLAIANLAVTFVNHKVILEENALIALFSLASTSDTLCRYYVAYALANLAANVDNHTAIVQEGGLQPIITLAYSQDTDIHHQACIALHALAVGEENKLKIVQEGGLEPLLLILQASNDIEILRECCGTLCSLSQSNENKYEIAKHEIIPCLLAHAQSEDSTIAKYAWATLANLGEITENQHQIGILSEITSILNMMRSSYIEVQREAGRTLANIAACAHNHEQIILTGGHLLLISYLLSPDVITQRTGSLGIYNLSINPFCRHLLMKDGAMEFLLSLGRSEDVDVEIQRYSILAIANLACCLENHKAMVEENTIPLLISLCTAPDEMVRQYTAYVLCKIALNNELVKYMTDAGAVEPILYLTRTDHQKDVLKDIIPALCNLSFQSANKTAICQNGGLPSLLQGLKISELQFLSACCIANLTEVVENHPVLFDAGTIPLLIDGLLEDNISIQQECLRGLGNLAVNPEHVRVIIRHEGLVARILLLLKSQVTRCQRMASMALCNLSASLDSQTHLVCEGVVEPIISILEESLDIKLHADEETASYCLLTVANLCASNKLGKETTTEHLTKILFGFSKHNDVKCRQHSIFAIGNIFSNKDALNALTDTEFLRPIISFAFPGDSNVQYQAIAALRGVSVSQRQCSDIINLGALEPLIIASKSDSIEIQREVAAALCNLSFSEENKIKMGNAGCIAALVNLSLSKDPIREQHALCALANMAEMFEGNMHRKMLEEGVLNPLFNLCSRKDVKVVREVSRCLALLSIKPESQLAVLHSSGLTQIMGFIDSEDIFCQRYGMLSLAFMAANDKAHKDLFEKNIHMIIQKLSGSVDRDMKRVVAYSLNNLAANEQNHISMAKHGILKAAVSLIQEDDHLIRLQGCYAIRRLCVNPKQRSQAVSFGCIKPLLTLAEADDIEVQREAVAALRNLSLSEEIKLSIILYGGLAGLSSCCHSQDVELAHQACCVLANLAESTENQKKMMHFGMLQHIKFVLHSKSIEIQREGLRTLANLSADFSSTAEIVSGGGTVPLITGLSSTDFLCQRYSSMGLANLSTNASNLERILEDGALLPLVDLAKFKNNDISTQRYAVFTLANIASSRPMHVHLQSVNTIELFFDLLLAEDIETKNAACSGLANFCAFSELHGTVIDDSVLRQLLALVACENNLEGQIRAVSALRGLTVNEDARLALIKLDALPVLLALTKSPNPELQGEVLATLCNLSLSGCVGENADLLTLNCSMPELVSFLCSVNITYRLFGAVMLGNLAADTNHQGSIIEAKGLSTMINVANTSDMETQRCLSYGLCNLASSPSTHDLILKNSGLPAILSLALCDDLKDQQTAFRSLRHLASFENNRIQMIEQGTLEPLIERAKTHLDEVLNDVVITTYLLSLEDRNKSTIAKSEMLSELSLIANEKPSSIANYGLATMGNIAENSSCHEAFLQLSNINTLLSLSLPKDSTSQSIEYFREKVRLLANLMVTSETNVIICENCTPSVLFDAIQINDMLSKQYILILLSNLLSAKEEYCSTDWSKKFLLQLQTFTSNFPRTDLQKFSFLLLGNFARRTDVIPFFLNQDFVNSISSSLIDDNQIETKFYAAHVFGKLAQDHQTHAYMRHSDAFTRLIRLILQSQAFPTVQYQGLFCLHNLSMLETSSLSLGQDLVLFDALYESSLQSQIENQQEVAACACILSLYRPNCESLAGSKFMASLATLCVSHDMQTSKDACAAIANIVEYEELHECLIEHKFVLLAIRMMKSRYSLVVREASRIIANLLSSEQMQVLFLEIEESIKCVNRIARCDDKESQLYSSIIYHKITVNPLNHPKVLEDGCLTALFYLVAEKMDEIKREAASALMHLCSNKENILVILSEGGIAILVKLLQEGELELRLIVSQAIEYLSRCTEAKRSIVQLGGLAALFPNCTNDSVDALCEKCVAALANLSENTFNQAAIVEQGGLKIFTEICVKTNNEKIFSEVSRCLANIASNKDVVGTMGDDVIYLLRSLVSSSSEVCRQYSAIAIGNIAITAKLQTLFLKDDCISCLVNLLSSKIVSCQEAAARAIYRLAASAENQEFIATQGAIPRLISLLENVQCRIFAAMGLCNLSCCPSNQNLIVKEGGVKMLSQLLFSSTNDCPKFCAMALCNLSQNSLNQILLVQHGVHEQMVSLLVSPQVEYSRIAVMVLANLSAHRDNRTKIVDAGAVTPVVGIASSTLLEKQRSSALILYNLSCCKSIQAKLIENGAASAVIKMASSVDIDCKRYSMLAICNFAASSETRSSIIRGGGLQTIILGCSNSDLFIQRYSCIALCNVGCDASVQVQLLVHGGLSPLLGIAGKGDIESRRFAIMALSNLAANNENHPVMISQGALDIALRIAQTEEEDIKEYAGYTIANFSSNVDHSATIGDAGGVIALLTLAQSKDVNTETLAVAGLRRLCQYSRENRGRIVRSGGINILSAAAESIDRELTKEIAVIFCNITLSDEYRLEVVKSPALNPLINLCQSKDTEIARHACGAIANIAENLETHVFLTAQRAGRFILGLVQHEDVDVHREASRALSNLLSSFDYHSDLVIDGLRGILHLASSIDVECQYNAVLSLRKLAPNVMSHQAIIYQGGLEALFLLSQSPVTNIRRQCILALRDLASDDEYKVKYMDAGGIQALVQFLSDNQNSHVMFQTTGIAALRHLSSHDRLKRPIVELGSLKPVLACCAHQHHIDLLCQCVGLLANLSENMANQISIVEEGTVPILIPLGKIDHGEIKCDVARILANLASNLENHNIMYGQGATMCLIELTDSTDAIVQRYAAMALRFLSSNSEIRVRIMQDNLLKPFLILSTSEVLDFRRTAANAFSSFSLNAENRRRLVRDGGLEHILNLLVNCNDLEVQRECLFSLSNLCDGQDYHHDVLRLGGITALVRSSCHEDARIQRDVSRGLALLSMGLDNIKTAMISSDVVKSCLNLTRSMDLTTQRYAALCLCNLSSSKISTEKITILEVGAIRPCLFLCRLPDTDLQKYAAITLGHLALGNYGNSKTRISEEGLSKHLIDFCKSPDLELQHFGATALNSLALGTVIVPKLSIMQEGGLLQVLSMSRSNDIETQRLAIYCIGSLVESEAVASKLMELGVLPCVINASLKSKDLELRRSCGYFLSVLFEKKEIHDEIVRERGVDVCLALVSTEDVECQEYGSFCLAHLASNPEYQTLLVKEGALRPLISLVSIHSEPRHYAGLALLKLADNYENHIKIAEEGGIQALLRLAKSKSTDAELQYKATISVGQLASTATKTLPTKSKLTNQSIGFGTNKMAKLTDTLAAKNVKQRTIQYIEDKIKEDNEEHN